MNLIVDQKPYAMGPNVGTSMRVIGVQIIELAPATVLSTPAPCPSRTWPSCSALSKASRLPSLLSARRGDRR